MARPETSKLTPQTQDQICRETADGNPKWVVAARANITGRTLRSWLSRGRKGEEPYASFASAFKKAEADAAAKHMATIELHSVNSWQAAAWVLERRWPEHYSANRRELNELRKQVQELLTAVHVGLSTATGAGGPVRRAPARHPTRR